MLKLKNWHYLNYKDHFYLCVKRKTNAFWKFTNAFGSFRRFRRVVKADSHVSGHRIRPKRKWTICYWQLFFMTVFIRRAPVEDNNASELIRVVASTYGCKILQPYEYGANVYGYYAICE